MKMKRFLLLFLIFILCLISISAISAENIVNSNDDIDVNNNAQDTVTSVNDFDNNNDISVTDTIQESNNKDYQIQEDNNRGTNNSLKAIDSKNYTINSKNFKTYFFNDNKLKPKYSNSNLIFEGEFKDMGVITINLPGVNITGSNALFNNTVFSINAENIRLNNLKFVLNKEFEANEYAGIHILKSNVELNKIIVQYTSIMDKSAYGIYIMGTEDYPIYNVKLSNSKVLLKSNARNNGNTYGLLMRYAINSSLLNNKFNCSLPLRSVDWQSQIYGGIFMDPVVAVAIEGCENLTVRSNKIYARVNYRPNTVYPTLDTVMVYMCKNVLFENNIISEIDNVTPTGVDNYLYGIDLYLSDDVTIIANNIHINSSGGMEAHGTAYPIQVSGPASNINIAFNNISSISHGPNIGIYSQNYYGSTQISIISNYINVTGLATNHTWALVSGIEVQDSDDLILNNTIEIHNLGSFNNDYKNYGISYSQNTGGKHKYNIQYNTIICDGNYGVYLSGTGSTVDDSIVANNRIQSATGSGNNAVYIGNGENNIIENNTDLNTDNKMPKDMIPNWLNLWLTKSGGNGSGFFKGNGSGNIGHGNGSGVNSNNPNGQGIANTKSEEGIISNSSNSGNSYSSTYSEPGELSTPSSVVGGSGGSSHMKAYELNEKKKIEPLKESNILFGTIFIIIILMLLFVGYLKGKESL